MRHQVAVLKRKRKCARLLRIDRLQPRQHDRPQNWLAFLSCHREVLVTFDFFTVPTLKVLYCFLMIQHKRCKVLHCNVTPQPTSDWAVRQLRETFSEAGSCYLLARAPLATVMSVAPS